MDKKLKKRLAAYGVRASVLTEAELSAVRKEVEAIERGQIVLDSVLDNPDIIYRKKS